MRLTLRRILPIIGALALVLSAVLVSMRDVYSSSPVFQSLATPDGSQWYGTQNGLYASEKGQRPAGIPLPSLGRHPHPSVYALAFDSLRSRLWIGAWDNLYCYDLLGKHFLNTTGIHVDMTVALNVLPDGAVEAETNRGRFQAWLADSLAGGACRQLDRTFYAKRIDETRVSHYVHRYDPTAWRLLLGATVALWVVVLLLIYIAYWGERRRRPDEGTDAQPEEASQSEDAGVSEADEKFIARLHELIDANLSNPEFSIEQLASGMALSRAQLFRKLKSACNATPLTVITERRVRRAAELLQQQPDADLGDICAKVGISDAATLRRLFIKHFGRAPK